MTIETPTQIKRQIQRMDQTAAKIDAAIAAAKANRRATWSGNKPHGKKPLPPFGRQWIEAGRRYGPAVVFGPGAWDFAERRKHCGFVLVSPEDRDPLDIDWTLLESRPTLLIEVGSFDTELLKRTAYALMMDGVPLVHPLRTVCLSVDPPRSWPRFVRAEYAGR